MHLIKTSRNSHRARPGAVALSAIVALFAAMAIAVAAPTTASANWTLTASAYNDTSSGFACPVATTATAEILDDYAMRVYTDVTIGYNEMWWNACRAWVFVDVVNKEGHVTNTFIYEPWAGPRSTNYLNANANAYGYTSNVSRIKVRQQRR